MTDERMAEPGMVIDATDVDAKLIRIRTRGQPHYTGGDMDAIQNHYGKQLGDLTQAEAMVATAWVYLRRARVEGASWEMAANECAVEYDETPMDPTGGGISETSPGSAATGVAPPETSTP